MPSLKQLQYFQELAKNENMSALAERLFVSQTALSNAITRLEDELGVQLFDRIGRGLVLNEYGKTYLTYVNQVICALKNATSALESIRARDDNNVSIAMNSALIWSDVLTGFMRNNTNYTITQVECNIDEINSKLPQMDVDLIIAGERDFATAALDHVVFSRDRIWLCVPPNHRLAGRKTMSLAEAKDEPFICQPKNTAFSHFSDELFRLAGFTPKIVAECDYALRRELLRQNVGVVLTSDSVLRSNFYGYGWNVLITDPPLRRNMAIFWSRGHKLPPAAVAFRDYMVELYSVTEATDEDA